MKNKIDKRILDGIKAETKIMKGFLKKNNYTVLVYDKCDISSEMLYTAKVVADVGECVKIHKNRDMEDTKLAKWLNKLNQV